MPVIPTTYPGVVEYHTLPNKIGENFVKMLTFCGFYKQNMDGRIWGTFMVLFTSFCEDAVRLRHSSYFTLIKVN